MSIENKINHLLNRVPGTKKVVKRMYQLAAYSVSPKLKSAGNIQRISPEDGKEYFFGYYDKSPWDASDRYMLCLRVDRTDKETAPEEPAEIVLFDTEENNEMTIIGQTYTWNVQQGAMLQWLGPDYSRKIMYNDFRNNEFCSVILDLETKMEKVLERPVYSVSENGKFALSLDFARLHRLRPGYGYSNKEEETQNQKLPNTTAIWKVDLETGKSTPLLKYTDFASFETREEMQDAEHKVNHIMVSPDGSRFMVLHRWLKGSRKYTRLLTANTDGTDLYNLSDDDMVSHCYWKNNEEIIAFARKKETGNGYYLMKDKTRDYKQLWTELTSDGHPSYSPDGSLIVTDTYPDRVRIARIFIMDKDNKKTVGKVFAPFKYDNDVRCDLHPRWNRKGDSISFDSVFEGKRGLYTVDIDADLEK